MGLHRSNKLLYRDIQCDMEIFDLSSSKKRNRPRRIITHSARRYIQRKLVINYLVKIYDVVLHIDLYDIFLVKCERRIIIIDHEEIQRENLRKCMV